MKIKVLFLSIILFSFSINAQVDFEAHITVDDTGGTNNPRSVFAADLDGDGDIDMLSASANDNKIAWYENTDGLGTFGPQQIISENILLASSVFATDLNGDGSIDVLATGSDADKIVWYKNLNGQGNFGPEQIISNQTNRPQHISAADLDNDGDMDVLSTSLSDNKIAWYKNTDGLGSFGPQQVLSTSFVSPMDISTGDINGDGFLDILSGSDYYNESSVAWFKNNNGLGNFYQQPELSSQVFDAGDTILMDVDNDGDLDIVVASKESEEHKIVWFQNTNGLGNFPILSQTLMAVDLSWPESLSATDVDNDNDMDLVVGSRNGGLFWFKNNGSGSFGPKQIIDSQISDVIKVVLADIDNDDNQDLIMAAGTPDKVAWYKKNNGQDNFHYTQELASINGASGVYNLSSIDLDNDGDKDILAALRRGNRIAWQENLNGLGTFSELKTIAYVNTPPAAYAGDVDGDGYIDVLAASKEKLTWYKNLDGQGNFGSEQIINNIISSETIYAADMDNDGDLDVLSSEANNTYWQENTDGLGTFGPIKIISDQYWLSDSMVAKDVDNDGDKDLILCYWGDGNIVWFENLDGHGNFGSANIIDTLLSPDSVYAADLDNDGDLDVLTLDYFTDEVMWYENLDGNGSFGDAHIISSSVEGAWTVYSADLDNDGDEDIMCTAYIEGRVLWFENDGEGNFSNENTIISNFKNPIAIFADDYDGDNDIDILTSSYFLDEIVWFENLFILNVEENTTNLFSIFPNPTNGILNIKSATSIAEITIYNNLGQLLFTSEKSNEVDISALSQGIYFVKIKDENGQTETKKILKK